MADGGATLYLSAMMRVRANAIERTATVEPGVTLGELDRETEPSDSPLPPGVC